MNVTPSFTLVPGVAVTDVLARAHDAIAEVVEQAYLLHAQGQSENPDSYFLRFAEKPSARIIALPAYLGGAFDCAGLKWISSFPTNAALDLPRASAVLVINDYTTGFPRACLEASQISAHRTAASAVLAAERLSGRGRSSQRLAIVGAGLIARHVVEYLIGRNWSLGEVVVHDHHADSADRFCGWLEGKCTSAQRAVDLEQACRDADLVVFATTAATPYVHDAGVFAQAPTVLHLSLRDLAPEVIASVQNITDDVEHSMKANTSLHLAEQQLGTRAFVAGTFADLASGTLQPDFSRPRVFSPFGLGVLDLAVASLVLEAASKAGTAMEIPGFHIPNLSWSS